jgi:NAD(P)-dependent dehydrogenase (short-subunit alcohol dehydrogenase family)
VELGLGGRVVLLVGPTIDELELLARRLEAEGAGTTTSDRVDAALAQALAEHGHVDAVVGLLGEELGTELLGAELGALEGRWRGLEELAGLYREAGALMAAAGWGRLVSVLPGSVKWLDDASDELATIVGLGVLGLHKGAVADLAPRGVAVNAILRGPEPSGEGLADLVAFLLSDGASYLHGVTIGLDGAKSPAVF